MTGYLLKIILPANLFILPLLGATNGFGYEQIKVLFFIVSITLIGLLWMGKGFKWTLIGKAAGVFILILLITSFLGIDPKSSLLGNSPYFQSWILYLYLYLFYLMIKTFKIEFKKYALVLAASSSIVAFLAIYDWVLLNILNQQIPTYAGRVVSTFGQPNFYAGFLLLTLPFPFFLFQNSNGQNSKLQLIGWGSGLISLIGIIVSHSRISMLLVLILFSMALLAQLNTKRILIAILAILTLIIFLFFDLLSSLVWKEFLNPLSTYNPDLTQESVEKRVYLWPQVLKIGLEKPLTGYGLENINQAFSTYFKDHKHPFFEENLQISPVLISLKDLNLDRTHNYLLDLFIFSGLSGAIFWLILLILLFKKLIQMTNSSHRNILLISLITYLTWIQFQNQSVVHLVYFWLLAGLIDRPDY